MHPILVRRDGGGVLLADLAPWYVSVLLEVPALLGPDQPEAVQRRLFPDPGGDEEARLEWHKLVHPELFSLIASAREIIQTDLQNLAPTPTPNPLGLWTIEIGRKHKNAWISGLNAARLALGERFGIADTDMRDQDETEEDAAEAQWTDKRLAVVKIHLLAVIQQILIEDQPESADAYPGTGS